jgi:xanthine phosphoribosyltransferase
MSIKKYYTDQDVKSWVHNIMRSMTKDNWRPDYIVGLGRGGLIPAVMLSHYTGIPMQTLDVSLRDGGTKVSNCGMAEDAFGRDEWGRNGNKKNILIVDDINDKGSTLQWIQDDWRGSCLPNDPAWDAVWGYNVRVAVMINNGASNFTEIHYVGKDINKNENDEWCVFPWENWWE